jgi:hypothetical protein
MATTTKNPTAQQIWKTLSQINVNDHTEERGGLTYLSWAWAWGIMMEHYPQLTVKWHVQHDQHGVITDAVYYPGDSASVSCVVTIGDISREMWLPVMDYRHKAISKPTSRDISDAKMRCLTKCFSLFGLASYIYQNEELPTDSASPKKAPKPKRDYRKELGQALEIAEKSSGIHKDKLEVVRGAFEDKSLSDKRLQDAIEYLEREGGEV